MEKRKFTVDQKLAILKEASENGVTETIENTEYSYKYQYNSKGLMIFETYPNNFTIKYEYDANGYLLGVKDAATNQFICQIY